MSTSKVEETGTLPMTVHREVVKYFSIGLYQNFARAVKELVSNAYDAGATEVKIRLDLISNRIIARDNGRGMDLADLKDHYLAIGFPTQLTEDIDELGRKRIGTFGIGSVSVFPYCEQLTVITKKRNTDKSIELQIDAGRFFKGGTFLLEQEAEKAQFPYKITKSDLPFEQGETIIILDQLKQHILNELREVKKPKGSSVEKLSGFGKFRWTLAQYCPLLFPPNREDLRDFFNYERRVPLRLWLDGEEVFRNVPEDSKILEKGEEQFGTIKVKYAILSPFGPVRPEQAKGLQRRIRDTGIGLPTDFDVTRVTGKVPGKLNYLCGEVHILEGLSNALMIDRDSFSYTEEVARMDEFFRRKLTKWNGSFEEKAEQDKELYEGLSETRGSEQILAELRKAEIIQFPKERLRISKGAIAKSKRRQRKPASPATRMKDVLSKEKGIQVEVKRGPPLHDEPPITIAPDRKRVVIYEEHPAFSEAITVSGKTYEVTYSEWNYRQTPGICKLETSDKVAYNLAHPLFESGLSDRVAKELSLGLLLILQNEPNGMKLLKKFENLLLDVFASRA